MKRKTFLSGVAKVAAVVPFVRAVQNKSETKDGFVPVSEYADYSVPPPFEMGTVSHIGTDVARLIPSRSEYGQQIAPVKLDSQTIQEIENAASGDPATRRHLTIFIARTKSRSKNTP